MMLEEWDYYNEAKKNWPIILRLEEWTITMMLEEWDYYNDVRRMGLLY